MTYTELMRPEADRTPAWYGRRREGVTASEVAAILGLSPYESTWSLWHRKKGLLGAEPDNEAMEWGRRIEELIRNKFAERHPELDVFPIGLAQSQRRPWQLATPDAVAMDSETLGVVEIDGVFEILPVAGVEAKTTDSWDGWGDEGSDDIPVYYRCQVLWQMDVLGVDCIYVPALSRGKDYREYVVTMDDDAKADLAVMVERAERFRDSLVGDEPPPIDEHPATTRALKALHPDVLDVDVPVPAELAETYREARRTVALAQADLDGATNELLHVIGDGRRAVDPDGRKVATRIVSERKSLDTKALAADHPDIAEQYRKTTTVAQLRATPEPKEKGSIR